MHVTDRNPLRMRQWLCSIPTGRSGRLSSHFSIHESPSPMKVFRLALAAVSMNARLAALFHLKNP